MHLCRSKNRPVTPVLSEGGDITEIDDAVERILANEPQLTRAEAVNVVAKEFEIARTKKQCKKRQRARKNGKNRPSKSSIRAVSGGAVSPR